MNTIRGTTQNDVIRVGYATAGVVGTADDLGDNFLTGAGNDLVYAGRGNDILQGAAGNDSLYGGAGNDFLMGGAGADKLDGEAGNDVIDGGIGNDVIAGGLGADRLIGGGGADIFMFGDGNYTRAGVKYLVDTGVGAGQRDVVVDFQQGVDLIDLSHINMSDSHGIFGPNLHIDREFTFIGTGAFTNSGAPELRYEVRGGHTILQMDGATALTSETKLPDGRVDAEIDLVGVFSMHSSDFML